MSSLTKMSYIGKLARIGEHRLPRRMMGAWIRKKRPKGGLNVYFISPRDSTQIDNYTTSSTSARLGIVDEEHNQDPALPWNEEAFIHLNRASESRKPSSMIDEESSNRVGNNSLVNACAARFALRVQTILNRQQTFQLPR
jgi:hypothetical protein